MAKAKPDELRAEIADELRDARRQTLDLVAGLDEDQLRGADADSAVNPFLWELGHMAWFCERFVLGPLGKETEISRKRAGAFQDSFLNSVQADALQAGVLYDSAETLLGDRGDLPLPGLEATLGYMRQVEEAMHAALSDGASGETLDAAGIERFRLAVRHEDMHGETLLYNRQNLGYPQPAFLAGNGPRTDTSTDTPANSLSGPLPGDAAIDGGPAILGAEDGDGFCFDNERGAHAAPVEAFRIARAPVTNAEFLAFVEDGGYTRPEIWDAAGRSWLSRSQASAPLHWVETEHDGWVVRRFDRCRPLAPHEPVVHVSHHEARAWCRWAGRRLPTEAEWEIAAATGPENGNRSHKAEGRRIRGGKNRFPWGQREPSADIANLDGLRGGCLDVAALPGGDSAHGCRQMLGNVWEWTASAFRPYPGFAPGPYATYSLPWFGTHMVLRGGSWATRGRIASNTYRNFFRPHRRDIYAGFRTCAAG